MSTSSAATRPAWATATQHPQSVRKGGVFSEAEEAQIRDRVLKEKSGMSSIWMVLGLILFLIIIFALFWFFFCRFRGSNCGNNNNCGKKKSKCGKCKKNPCCCDDAGSDCSN